MTFKLWGLKNKKTAEITNVFATRRQARKARKETTSVVKVGIEDRTKLIIVK